MFNFVLISLVHPSRKICHLYLTYCVVVSVSGSCSTKCFWLCPLFHFPWKQLSHSKSPRVPRSHLTHQGTILAVLRTFTWSFIVSSKNGRNSAKIRNCWISTYFKVRIDLFQQKGWAKWSKYSDIITNDELDISAKPKSISRNFFREIDFMEKNGTFSEFITLCPLLSSLCSGMSLIALTNLFVLFHLITGSWQCSLIIVTLYSTCGLVVGFVSNSSSTKRRHTKINLSPYLSQ